MSKKLFVGVDVGSSATKCVVLDATGALSGSRVVPSGLDYANAIDRALSEALQQAGGCTEDIASCISTGYGRKHVARAQRVVTEISAHARGAREWNPDIRTIVDIGGQDTKVIQIDDQGQLVDYRMNAKCAAGTGTFLEATALKLGLSMRELDELAVKSKDPAVVNSYCTVFAGTEVIERIKDGQAPEDISMGLFRSIARRVKEMIPGRAGAVGATGGVVQHCRAMRSALEQALGCDILLSPTPQLAGAYGAALIAWALCPENGKTVDHAAIR